MGEPASRNRTEPLPTPSAPDRLAVVLLTALWTVGWAALAIAWWPGLTDHHLPARALVLFLAIVPMIGIGIGLAVAWAPLVLSGTRVGRERLRAVVGLATTAALALLFWSSVAAWSAPEPVPDPASATGFDQPSWLSLNRSFVIAVAQVAVAAALLASARTIGRDGRRDASVAP